VDLPAPSLASYAAEPRSRWRTAAIVTAGVAALELVALVVIALAFIAKPFADDAATKRKASAQTAQTVPAGEDAKASAKKPAPVAKLSRAQTPVLVLNGNGVSGAAGSAAARVSSLHYPIAGVTDASRRDFPRTIVMYRPGFQGEALRLARDLGLGVRRAVPLDGMRAADLGLAKLALVVGG
jgi:hypothetical protein